MQILVVAFGLLAQGGENANGKILGIDPLILMAIMFAFYFIILRPANNEKKHRQTLLDSLKKNDRVVTAAGIKGTIYSVNREKNEAVLTIDKSTKAQMTVTLESIGHVIVDENKKTEDKKPETD